MNRVFSPIVKVHQAQKVEKLEVVVDAIKNIIAFFILLLSGLAVMSQPKSDLPKQYNVGEVEIDILGSYYEQDGIHSAVEGGEGSQELTDMIGSVILNVPIDTVNLINISVNYDSYTSASSSQISWNDGEPAVSSPSYEDERAYGNFTYSRITEKDGVFSIGAGFSDEWDVFSHSYTLGWQKSFDNENKTFGIDGNMIFDNWSLIYPSEISAVLTENGTELKNDLRQTYGLTATYSAVINKKMQAQIVYNFTFQSGLLSTPFHRVYFDTTGTNIPIIEGNSVFGDVKRHPFVNKDIERLPSEKYKNAIAGRFNYYISNWFVLRTFYRYYFDTFGVNSHTLSFELPVKPTRFLTIYPFYRFHFQTASTFFEPFLQHKPQDKYYTSDYDLSGFTAHKFGLGVTYSPPEGIVSLRNVPFKNRTSAFEALFFRYARYYRSDELEAFIISSGVRFSF